MGIKQAVPGAMEPAGGTPDQPLTSGDRLVALDLIRGIAVLGILFANITAFGHSMLAYFWPGALPGGGDAIDGLVWLFQLVFVDGKFRGLFTLLFGAGMYLFMERVWTRGGSRWLQARRLFWLAVFGIAHFMLIWIGDILFLYALSGFAGLAMMRWKPKTQLRVGIAWYVVMALLLTFSLGAQASLEMIPEARSQAGSAWQDMQEAWEEQVADARETDSVMHGSYSEITAHRVTAQSHQLAEVVIFALIETVPLMLMGMALYRYGFFSGGLNRSKMRRWGWIGFAGGAIVTLGLGWLALAADFPPYLTQFLFNGASALPRLAMVLGMAALLVLAAPNFSKGWLGSRLVAAGRMAFSNYLGTSVVMLFVFQGWAGGLYGQLHRAQLLIVVLIGWALMLGWSKPWLAKFRYGPLEWLWRCLTYGKIFPMRR